MKPCKNRLLQQSTTPKRKLFDAPRRAVFLEVFAATCNVRLSAARAGVAYQTVFKHRMKDAAFAAAWDEALQQGYAFLEARLLEEARYSPAASRAASGSLRERPSTSFAGPAVASQRLRLPRSGEDFEGFAEENFDPDLALTLLREHARRLPGSSDKRKRQRTTVTVATHEEVVVALTKKLKTFAVRERGPSTTRSSARGPPPHPAKPDREDPD